MQMSTALVEIKSSRRFRCTLLLSPFIIYCESVMESKPLIHLPDVRLQIIAHWNYRDRGTVTLAIKPADRLVETMRELFGPGVYVKRKDPLELSSPTRRIAQVWNISSNNTALLNYATDGSAENGALLRLFRPMYYILNCRYIDVKMTIIHNSVATDYKAENEDLRSQLGHLSKENDDLRNQVGKLQRENDDLRSQLVEVRKENDDLRNQLVEVRKENDDLRNQLVEVRKENDDLRSQLVEVRKENDDFRNQLVQVRKENDELRSENSRLFKMIDELNTKVALLLKTKCNHCHESLF